MNLIRPKPGNYFAITFIEPRMLPRYERPASGVANVEAYAVKPDSDFVVFLNEGGTGMVRLSLVASITAYPMPDPSPIDEPEITKAAAKGGKK